jgi:uncharacterized protein YlxP (DUF503 family)
MHIGVCKFTIRIPSSHSLKAKRRVVSSLCQRIRNQFNIAVAEVDDNDVWQMAAIGISCVSSSSQVINKVLSQILSFVQQHAGDYILVDYHQEIIPWHPM